MKRETRSTVVNNINDSNTFTTKSNKVYKKIDVDSYIDAKDIKEKIRTILYLTTYYYHVCNLDETYHILEKYGIKRVIARELIEEYETLSNNKKRYIYISIINSNCKIKGCFTKYFKLTNLAKAHFLSSPNYRFIKELIEQDIDAKYKYVDAYTLAMKQHTSIQHYSAIQYLYNKCVKEDIIVKHKHNETSLSINSLKNFYYGNRRRVEFDLILKYNRKQVGVEVECGTTSNTDMYKKVIKHHALSVSQKVYRDIIIACPNQSSLETTRNKINKAIDRYYREEANNFMCSFAVNYYYLNLSTLNKKNIRVYLNEAINKKLHQLLV